MGRKGWTFSFRADDERLSRAAEPEGRDCARGEWCASAVRKRLGDGTMARVPAKGPRAFCAADEAIITASLRAFPATWSRLWPALLTRADGEVLVRIPFGPSVPVRTDVDQVMRMLVDCALSWHERVAAVAPLARPDTQEWHRKSLGRHAPALLAGSVAVLAVRIPSLLSLEAEPMVRPSLVTAIYGAEPEGTWGDSVMVEAAGEHAGLEVLRLDYLARAALGEIDPAPVRLLGVPCRECSRRALQAAPPRQHDGDTQWYSVCSWCRDTMEEPAYRAWVKSWAVYYRNRVTPAMAAAS